MNPHARSATARCWSPPAGEGVLLVLSLARMRYGSPINAVSWKILCFLFLVASDWWLVTGKSFVIRSLAGLQELVDMALAPYPTWRQVERMKSIKEMISFSIYQISLKMCAHDPALMDSETALSSSDFITPLYIKTEKWGKKRTFWRLEFHYFEFVVGCLLLVVGLCSVFFRYNQHKYAAALV